MKYIVFLGDGMADYPIEALDGKTPLSVAKKANIDFLAPKSEIGLAKTVPDGMKPGSDTANLSVMGYDPRSCYSGRSPLEALSMGLTLGETDIAVRCNLVTLSSEEELYADKRMIDYSAGEISSEESGELIRFLEEKLGNQRLSFHAGISYRHCLIVHDAEIGSDLTPPHDITGKRIKRHLPSGKLGDLLLDLQKKSYDLLKDHPINLKRIAEGKNPANSIWLWGEGTKPNIPDFQEKNGISGAVISAVDLLKGIGKGANMKVIDVEGATGNINTDFAAKGRAAIDALKEVDYVYIHVEAPDESGHQGSLTDKISSIEQIDEKIVGPVLSYLRESGEDFHVLVCPDHPTPLSLRTHTSDPIPYLIYRSDSEQESGVTTYNEETAKSTGIFESEGFHLIDRLLSSESTVKEEEGISPDLVTLSDGSADIPLKMEEDTIESEEHSDPFAAPSEEEAEANREEPQVDLSSEEQPAKKEKPRKYGGSFFKRHLRLFIIAILLLLVAGGLTAGHFIATRHLAFIHSEANVQKAMAKERITTLVLKKDVTLDGDLKMPRTVNLDLNEHTLTVKGALSIPVNEDLSIGYKTKGEYKKGGKIVAKSFTLTGTKGVTLLADLDTAESSITCSNLTLESEMPQADGVHEFNVAKIAYSGRAAGTFKLSTTSSLTLNGEVREITGGSTVHLKSGKVTLLSDAQEVYLYEGASAEKIVNVGNYYHVTTLAAPKKITVVEENGDFILRVSEVIGATEIRYTVNDVEKDPVKITAGSHVTEIRLEELIPGEQTVSVIASAPDDPCYLDSEAKSVTFSFSAKLGDPTVNVSEEDGKVSLIISEVNHANSYRYTIDGNEHKTKENELTVDISEDTKEGGVHIIEVVAESDNKYYAGSNAVMTSYIRYLTLEAPEPELSIKDKTMTVNWEIAEGSTIYLVTYGKDKIHTTLSSLDLPYIEGAQLTIRAIGGSYYLDSESTLSGAEIRALLFPQGSTTEPKTETPTEPQTDPNPEPADPSGDNIAEPTDPSDNPSEPTGSTENAQEE